MHDRNPDDVERGNYLEPALRIRRGRLTLAPNAEDRALYEARRQRFVEMHGPDVPMPAQRARDTDRDLLEPRARGPIPRDVRMGLLGDEEYREIHQGRNHFIRNLMADIRGIEEEYHRRFIQVGRNPDDPRLQPIIQQIEILRGYMRDSFGIDPEEIDDILGGTRVRRKKSKKTRRRTKKKKNKRKKRN
jgi:hypothetical protein